MVCNILYIYINGRNHIIAVLGLYLVAILYGLPLPLGDLLFQMPALYSGEVFAESTLQTYLEGIPLSIGALISYDTLGYRPQGIFPRTAPLHNQPSFVGSLGEKRKLANARTLFIA